MENEMIQTRTHPETGEVLRRRRRDEIVGFKGLSKTVSVEGWFPDGEGDGILTKDDVAPLDAALAELKAASRGSPD
jgi:HTH-type transcriptional regulator/antitoxin MqsA